MQCVCACMRLCMRAYTRVQACVHTCAGVCACVRVYVRMQVSVLFVICTHTMLSALPTITHKDFEHFMNLNARSPEYLSLYIDEMLKKGVKEVGLHWYRGGEGAGLGRC